MGGGGPSGSPSARRAGGGDLSAVRRRLHGRQQRRTSLIWTFMAMGLALIWGYGGSLSFGQTAFFGAGGLRLRHPHASTSARPMASRSLARGARRGDRGAVRGGAGLLPVLRPDQRRLPRHRHAVGHAGRSSASWRRRRARNGRIGTARLNGFNGMRGMPPLTIPWPAATSCSMPDVALYYVVLGLMHRRLSRPPDACELALRQRARRDPREPRAGRDAGLRRAQVPARRLRHRRRARGPVAACSTPPGASTSRPSTMGITAAALPVIWVAVGGRIGPDRHAHRHALVVLSLFQALTIYGSQYALVVMGLLLVVTVLFAPEGLVCTLALASARSEAGRGAGHDRCSKPTASASSSAASTSHADVDFTRRGRRDPLPDRPEWGRQESRFFRLILGEHRPDSGQHPVPRARTSPALHVVRAHPPRHERQVPGARHLHGADRAAEPGDRAPAPLARPPMLDGEIDRRARPSPSWSRWPTRQAGTSATAIKQWLEIGMAIGVEPQLLLLDEPTAGMSPEETHAHGRDACSSSMPRASRSSRSSTT